MKKEPLLNEEDVIERAKQGDADAWKKIVRHYNQFLFNVSIVPLEGNIDDAKDNVQNAWRRISQKINQFQGKSAFSTWIYRITMNLAYDFLRAQARRVYKFSVYIEDLDRFEVVDLSEFGDLQTAKRILDAIDLLSPENREALVLFTFSTMSYKEIADHVGCNLGTVMSRIYNARMQLRRHLADLL